MKRLTLCAFCLPLMFSSGQAAILTSIPMHGDMIMPKIYYNANITALRVTVDLRVPQLTPLLIGNPNDSFDPADPWYNSLDPSRQGLAFSKRYGFVMDTESDLLLPGRQIWIRKLSSSPGLSVYRCITSEPKSWQPIFGTEGSTNALYWNGNMFHPVFTAPADTNTYSATFEAFVLDTLSGTEVPGSSSGPFTLNWTDVPDGRPTLGIGQRITLFLPNSATNYVLEGTQTLPDGIWTAVTNTPINLEGQRAVVLDATETRKFFRMKLAP